ncbi:hypothetical protein TrVFT333_000252 [Trichoderma virens FT-333]|nr:hypothetical protein TrVFT333_000252 [Trichoderma virens FT-333]
MSSFNFLLNQDLCSTYGTQTYGPSWSRSSLILAVTFWECTDQVNNRNVSYGCHIVITYLGLDLSSIRRYTPSVATSEEKETEIKWNSGLKLGIDGPGAGVPLTAEPEIAKEKSYTKVERMKIEALCTGIYNRIMWAIT